MKKAVFLILVVFLSVFALISNGQSQTKNYYSGDAVSFNGQVYVGSANTNSLEVLKLEHGDLKLLAKIKPFNARFNNYGKFYDLKFSVESDKLFVYAISDFSLYKYQIVGDEVQFLKSNKNTYWEWYTRVDKFGDNLVTISDKGVKIWNANMDVIISYPFTNSETPYNISGNNSRFILNIQDNKLTVFDAESRSEAISIPLNYKTESDIHRAYQDAANNIYAVDDYYMKKFDSQGHLLGSFKHQDYPGYDVAASGLSDYLYFSNGLGVVKINKNTMESPASVLTGDMGGARGWAMNLKVINAAGDKVVVFNNSNILVLDDNLKKLASYEATEEKEINPLENLFLSSNHNFGAPTAVITLTGGGYLPKENLNIFFGDTKVTAKADERGRFTQDLTVPALPAGKKDIKVDGETSHLTYSLSFQVNK
ncbi:MAG: hypothetical protein WC458_03190 [Patescibacteria group bacterium]